jgi:hypothetical protein
MPDADRQVILDELEAGFFRFLLTGTEMGSDGFAGYYHYVPVDPIKWSFFLAHGHSYSEEWDAATSRINARLTGKAAGTSYLRKRVLLPYDFGSFPANAISVVIRAHDITGPALTLTMYIAGAADSGINGSNILPGMDDTYTLTNETPADAYSPGDWVTFEIAYTSDAAAQYVDVSDLSLAYVSARGNV